MHLVSLWLVWRQIRDWCPSQSVFHCKYLFSYLLFTIFVFTERGSENERKRSKIRWKKKQKERKNYINGENKSIKSPETLFSLAPSMLTLDRMEGLWLDFRKPETSALLNSVKSFKSLHCGWNLLSTRKTLQIYGVFLTPPTITQRVKAFVRTDPSLIPLCLPLQRSRQ